ncbi:Lanthionine synthetase C-like protein [compost metagenome]
MVQAITDVTYNRTITKLTHKGAHLGGFHFGLSSSIIPLLICLEFFNDKRATELLTAYSNYLTEVLEDECWQKYFWGCDFLSGMFGTLSVLTKIFELTYDTRFCKLASALFAKIESILKVRNSKKIIAFERSVTIREDELLSGLSHGVMGCAYSTYYYNSIIAKDNAVESIFLDFLDWEISAYDECIHNWKDYRRRSQSTKGEFSWSHGLPGNYLVLKHLSDNGVKAAKDFVSNNPPAKYFSFETLLKRPRPVNDSLCHGAYGLINIIKKVYPAALNDHRIYIWANLRNLANQDIRELRVRAADPLGLWVGKVGSLLGSIGLLESGFTFPFLPHEMQYIQQ